MTVKANSLGGPKPQFLDANGDPYSGALLFFYASGSSTKQNTYTDSAGGSANTNPIVLDSSGRPSSQIWFTEGLTYKAVLAPSTDTDPPASPIFTVDGLSGINDTTTSVDEWISSGLTPTYVSATSFTFSGDQTTNVTVGRRIKSVVTAGTIYSTIVSASYSAPNTTVTVVNDSGSLDSGLSSVSLSLSRADHPSGPPLGRVIPLSSVAGTNTITGTASPAAPLQTNQIYTFIPANTNTGATTLNISSLGAKNVYFNGAALIGGELRANVPVQVMYDGTQFNLLTNGGRGLVLLKTATASSSAAVDFTSVIDSAKYTEYVLEFDSVIPATDTADLWLRYSTDNGSSFITSASYDHARNGTNAGSAAFDVGAAADSKIVLVNNLSNTASRGVDGVATVKISAVNGVRWQLGAAVSGGGFSHWAGAGRAVTSAINAVRVMMSTGNIASGNFQFYGVRK